MQKVATGAKPPMLLRRCSREPRWELGTERPKDWIVSFASSAYWANSVQGTTSTQSLRVGDEITNDAADCSRVPAGIAMKIIAVAGPLAISHSA
jgi:hypothetical protein